MAFWSKLGKGLLKIAPFAAYAIPGVGPIAGSAIQAGIGAAKAKAGGGGLKDVLLGAGTGAATSAIPGGAGLAPSKGFLSNLGGIAKETGKNVLKDVGTNVATSALSKIAGGTEKGRAVQRGEEKKKKRQPIGPTEGGSRPRMDMRTPNLSYPIMQGANEALASMGRPPREPTWY